MIAWVRRNWWWVVGLGLAGYKLALLRSQHIYAIGNAHHDDALFVKLAGHITRGEWLGPYNELTLSKGPAYPIFIAWNFWTGIPLGLSQQLLYLAACLLVVWALAPIMKAGWARLLTLTLLFYNPLTYEGLQMTRLLRQHLTIPMALIIVAGLIALTLRQKSFRWDVNLPWAALTGAALGVFSLTREEGIWIAPVVCLVSLALVIAAAIEGRRSMVRIGATLGVLVVAAWFPIARVSFLNEKHYGWYGTVDYKSDEFQAMVGALTRVKVGPNLPYVQVSAEARDAIYEASPTFAELRPHLESGPVADKWMEKQVFAAEDRQYRTGWFGWALRDAIRDAGYFADPTTFVDFCGKVAAEVNAACDSGALPAGGERSGFLPRWNEAYGEAMKAGWRAYWNETIQLTRFETIVPESAGSDDEIRPFVDLSYDSLSPAPRTTYFHKPAQIEQNRWKLDQLRWLGQNLGAINAMLIKLGLILLLLRGLERLARRRWSWLTWLAFALGGTILAELMINFMVHTMAFENFYIAAWAPAYPLFLLLFVLMVLDVTTNWIRPAAGFVMTKIRGGPAAARAAKRDAVTGDAK